MGLTVDEMPIVVNGVQEIQRVSGTTGPFTLRFMEKGMFLEYFIMESGMPHPDFEQKWAVPIKTIYWTEL